MMYLKNNLLLAFALSLCMGLASAQNELTYYYGKVPEGKEACIFGDQVNIREAPTTTAKSLGKLKIGTKVTVKSQGVMHVVNGVAALWHEVQAGKLTGWVWGGYLSLTYRELGDRLLLYGLTRFSPDSNFFGEARLVKSGKIISRVPTQPFFTSMGDDSQYNYCVGDDVQNATGLEGIDYVWKVDFIYEACGYVNGGQYFALCGNQLIYIGETPGISEAGVFHVESKLVFPWDKEGKAGQVILHEETSEFDEKLEDYKITETTDSILTWDGKVFRKK